MNTFKTNTNQPINPKGLALKKSILLRNWPQVRSVVTCNTNNSLTIPCEPEAKKKHSSSSSNLECTPLLFMCRHDPPLHIVSNLLKVNPSAAFETDDKNNLPLHVACQNGASPKIIQALLRANEEGAMKRNVYGMLPIHLACRFYHYRNAGLLFADKVSSNALREVLRALLTVRPEMILEEDDNNMCPIQHAIERNMQAEVLYALQKEAQIQYLKRLKETHVF